MKIIKVLGIILITLLVILFLFGFINLRDRHPGYEVDIKIENNRVYIY